MKIFKDVLSKTILLAAMAGLCACGGGGGGSGGETTPEDDPLPEFAGAQMRLSSGNAEYFYFVDTTRVVVKRRDGTEYDGAYVCRQNELVLSDCRSRHGTATVNYSGTISGYRATQARGRYRFTETHSEDGSASQESEFVIQAGNS